MSCCLHVGRPVVSWTVWIHKASQSESQIRAFSSLAALQRATQETVLPVACAFTASNLLISVCSAGLRYTVNSISLLSGHVGHMHRNAGSVCVCSGDVRRCSGPCRSTQQALHTRSTQVVSFTVVGSASFITFVQVGPSSLMLGKLYTNLQ